MRQIGTHYNIPDGLVGSTMHGAALDLNQDYNRPPNTPVLLPPYILRKITPDEMGTTIYDQDCHMPPTTFPDLTE